MTTRLLTFCGLIAALTLPLRAQVSYVNATGVALGSSHSISDDQFLGARFEVTAPLQVTQFQATISSSEGSELFLAVVNLPDRTAFPTASATSGLADPTQVRFSTTFSPGIIPFGVATVVNVPVSFTLPAGSYAVVIGAGLYGSPPTSFGGMQNYAEVAGSNTIAWTAPVLAWHGGYFDIIAAGVPAYRIGFTGTPVTAPVFSSPNTATFIAGRANSFTVTATGSPAPTFGLIGGTLPAWASFNSVTGILSGTPPAGESSTSELMLVATSGSLNVGQNFTLVVLTKPTIVAQPLGGSYALGGNVTLTVQAQSTPSPTYQWRKNGVVIPGAILPTLTVGSFQATDAGVYSVAVTNTAGTTVSDGAVVGVASTAKVLGSGTEVAANIVHPNGNVYDQVLLTGASTTITADAGQITRTSFLDLNDDIVQVEFSGTGTLTIVLDSATGPAAPVKYNSPGVDYMKGHARLIVSGANENTHLSIFSVGRLTAVNQALFKEVAYDGWADVASVIIGSANGKFGGLRAANATFFATRDFTGVQAPNVTFTGPVYLGNVNAVDTATPVLLLGGSSDARITGGNFAQTNGRAVQVSGITQLRFVAGANSHGTLIAARANQAHFEQNGADVTTQIVVNP